MPIPAILSSQTQLLMFRRSMVLLSRIGIRYGLSIYLLISNSLDNRSFVMDSGTKWLLMAEHLAMVRENFPQAYQLLNSILGVYLAKEASTSMSHYAGSARSSWQKSAQGPTNCVALTEVVNLPSRFVSKDPHYVIKDTHWIMW